MTPVLAVAVAWSAGICGLRGRVAFSRAARVAVSSVGRVAEQLLDLVAAPLHPAQREPEVGDAVAHRVVGAVAADGHQQAALVTAGPQAAAGEFGPQCREPLFHL